MTCSLHSRGYAPYCSGMDSCSSLSTSHNMSSTTTVFLRMHKRLLQPQFLHSPRQQKLQRACLVQEGVDRENEAIASSLGGHTSPRPARRLLGSLDSSTISGGCSETRRTGCTGKWRYPHEKTFNADGKGDKRRYTYFQVFLRGDTLTAKVIPGQRSRYYCTIFDNKKRRAGGLQRS